MKTKYSYFKNSSTGELVMKQEFTETDITGIPIYFYNQNRKSIGENLDLVGFVEIKEKTFKRECKRQKI